MTLRPGKSELKTALLAAHFKSGTSEGGTLLAAHFKSGASDCRDAQLDCRRCESAVLF